MRNDHLPPIALTGSRSEAVAKTECPQARGVLGSGSFLDNFSSRRTGIGRAGNSLSGENLSDETEEL